jgi:predicted Zn-dependent protease
MSSFIARTHSSFDSISQALLSAVTAGEELTVSLSAEESLFVRFNGNRVRQNTDVEQLVLNLRLQKDGRTSEKARTLSGNTAFDQAALLALLEACRKECLVLPKDPNQVSIANNGVSSEEFKGSLLSPEALVAAVTAPAAGCDLAGIYAGGAVIRANKNSKGQSHWFATETFSLDYSLYNGPKAAKGVYAGTKWSAEEWAANLGRTKKLLELLSSPEQNVKPGQYKTYLAPSAFNELVGMTGWWALSGAAWKQGRSPFKKLAEKEAKLSPLFNLSEDFSLGLTPRFNSLGEVAPQKLPLIEKGELKNLLVSSRTAKEYGLAGNFAADSEAPRSFDIGIGSLDEKDVLKELGTGLYLSNLHYLNWSDPVSARITGMTRYACFWVEGGEIRGPIKDLRWDESLYDCLGNKLLALTKHSEIHPATDTYNQRSLGGSRGPGALIDRFTFTL